MIYILGIFVIAVIAGVFLAYKGKTNYLPLLPVIWVWVEFTALFLIKQLYYFPLILIWYFLLEILVFILTGQIRFVKAKPREIVVVERLGKRRLNIIQKQMLEENLSIQEDEEIISADEDDDETTNKHKKKTPFKIKKRKGIFDKIIPLLPFDSIECIVDLKELSYNIEKQTITTKDKLDMLVDISVRYLIINPLSYINVKNFLTQLNDLSLSSLRNVVNKMTSDEVMEATEKIQDQVRQIMNIQTQNWGVEVLFVSTQDLQPPTSIKANMEQVANAELKRRADITKANGEKEVAQIEADKRLIDIEAKAKAKVLEGEAEAKRLEEFKKRGVLDTYRELKNWEAISHSGTIFTSAPGIGASADTLILANAIKGKNNVATENAITETTDT